ncbi:MAG: hypothetical protein WDZ73_00625 [Candidatus Paceibacterota bacterium]
MKTLFSAGFWRMLTLFIIIVIVAITFLIGVVYYDLNFNQTNSSDDASEA